MAINKVEFGGRTLIDLTDTTATADKILTGYGAYGKDGVWVDGTAIESSPDGSVYQDAEGYVVLDDGAGTHVEVESLSVTENGTYTAPTGYAYSPVSVDVETGDILPHFYIHYASDYSTITSTTCDMTFSEMLTLMDADTCTALVYEGFPDEVNPDEESYSDPKGATCRYDSVSIIIYTIDSFGGPFYTTTYTSDGVLSTVINDHRYASDLIVNGATVTAPSGYYPFNASKSVASAAQATPVMSFTSTTGRITATATQTSGYVSAGTKTSAYQLTVKAAATYTPTETAQTINSYQWLTGVQTIAAISSTYVGTGVTQRSAADMTASGEYITAPSGYYSQAFSKAVDMGSLTFDDSYLSFTMPSGNISLISSTGLLTVSVQAGTQRSPSSFSSGYFSSIQSYRVGVNTKGSYSLPTLAATIYTPTTITQTISSYQWLTGAQTIEGDTNLISSNIKSGVSIFGVVGTMEEGIVDPYYSLYKSLAHRNNTLDSAMTSLFADYINSLSKTIIGNGEFADTRLVGDCTFNNIITIDPCGFGFLNPTTTDFYNGPLHMSFPRCSYMGYSAFYRNPRITSVDFDICTYIGSQAFYLCENLEYINAPLVTSMGNSTFYNCHNLRSVNMPNLSSLPYYAFESCSALTEVSFPNALYISDYAFIYCSSLAVADFQNVSSIGNGAFTGCRSLNSINFPTVRTIAGSAFRNNVALNTITFPSCTSIGNNAFYNCIALSFACLPMVASIGSSAFLSCSALTSIFLPMASVIYPYAFQSCYNLLSLYLLGSYIAKLSNINAFLSTPISTYTTSTGGVYGSIYVPASLYDSYIASTNWVTYSSRFVSLTDAEIEALNT